MDENWKAEVFLRGTTAELAAVLDTLYLQHSDGSTDHFSVDYPKNRPHIYIIYGIRSNKGDPLATVRLIGQLTPMPEQRCRLELATVTRGGMIKYAAPLCEQFWGGVLVELDRLGWIDVPAATMLARGPKGLAANVWLDFMITVKSRPAGTNPDGNALYQMWLRLMQFEKPNDRGLDDPDLAWGRYRKAAEKYGPRRCKSGTNWK